MPSMLRDEALNNCQLVIEDPDKGGVTNTHTQGMAIYEVGYGTPRIRLPNERKYAYTLYFIVCIFLVCAPLSQARGKEGCRWDVWCTILYT